jgi:muramidase (phage lysozyme)
MSEKQAAVLENPNVRQFLDFLGKAEGADYNVIVGGKKFDDFSKHPNVVGLRTKEGPSTAAGKYQIVKTTYDDIAPKLGITDFSPQSQDRIAVALLDRRGALDDVVSGKFDSAINKLGKEWASLPSSTYKQPKKDWDFVSKNLPSQTGQIAPKAVATTGEMPVEVVSAQETPVIASSPTPGGPTKLEQLPESYRQALAANYLADTEEDSVADAALAMLEEREEASRGGGGQNTALQALMKRESVDPYQFILAQDTGNTDQGPRRKVVPRMPQRFSEGGDVGEKFAPNDFDPIQALRRLERYAAEQPRIQVESSGGAGPYGGEFSGMATMAVPLTKGLEGQAYIEGYGFKPRGQAYQGVAGGGVRMVKRFTEGGDVAAPDLMEQMTVGTLPEPVAPAQGLDVFYPPNQVEQMTVGTLPEQVAPSPADTAVNEYLRMQSKLVTDPKEYFRSANQRLRESIERDPTEFAMNFTGQGIAGILKKPGGTMFSNPASNFATRIKDVKDRLKLYIVNDPEKQAAAVKMFSDKGRDFLENRAGTFQDEIRKDLLEGRIKLSKEDKTFPSYLIDAAKGGNRAAMRDLEAKYDEMLGIEGAVVKANSATDASQESAQSMFQQFKQNPNMIPDDTLANLLKKPLRDVPAIRDRLKANPEFFSAVIEPKLAPLLNPNIRAVSPKQIEDYPNLFGKLEKSKMTPNELETASRGNPIYDISYSTNFFGLRLDDLAKQTPKMSTKELQDIDFATFVRRATKLKEQEKLTTGMAEKVRDFLPKKVAPNKEMAETLLFGTKQVLATPEGLSWRKVVDPDATIIQAAALKNSIDGYSRYGSYGTLSKGRQALDDGEVELYVLYNKDGIPVTQVEYVKDPASKENYFSQVFGNGPLTGNVVPESYLPQVKALIQELKPNRVPASIANRIQNFAKGGMVDKPLYDRAV